MVVEFPPPPLLPIPPPAPPPPPLPARPSAAPLLLPPAAPVSAAATTGPVELLGLSTYGRQEKSNVRVLPSAHRFRAEGATLACSEAGHEAMQHSKSLARRDPAQVQDEPQVLVMAPMKVAKQSTCTKQKKVNSQLSLSLSLAPVLLLRESSPGWETHVARGLVRRRGRGGFLRCAEAREG